MEFTQTEGVLLLSLFAVIALVVYLERKITSLRDEVDDLEDATYHLLEALEAVADNKGKVTKIGNRLKFERTQGDTRND